MDSGEESEAPAPSAHSSKRRHGSQTGPAKKRQRGPKNLVDRACNDGHITPVVPEAQVSAPKPQNIGSKIANVRQG